MSGDAGGDPVFVLCAGRSGSTLLRFLLDAHPDLACPPETKLPWLCTQLAAAWAVIEDAPVPSADPAAEQPVGNGDDDAVPASVAAGLRRSLDPMIASYLARHGKKRYCDKSLGAARHAALLLQVWPGARFICLYRHPMDVIGSGIEASPWGLTSYGFEPYVATPPDNNVAAIARYWLDYTTAILAAEDRFADRCLPVRYEDLVAEPDREAAHIFDFVGAARVPGIVDRAFGSEHQRFGPGDYKIWSTTQVTDESVGRGWSVPSRLIPQPVLDRVNELADVLGYLQVGEGWGTGSRPTDLRVPAALPESPKASPAKDHISTDRTSRDHIAENRTARDRTAEDRTVQDHGRVQSQRELPDWATTLDDRIRAGLTRPRHVGTPSTGSPVTGSPVTGSPVTGSPVTGSPGTETVLLFASAPGPARPDADAWWLLDLAARTVAVGFGERKADADWSVTGSAEAWQRVLTGRANLGVAFRRGDLRYADNGDAGAGSLSADSRAAMLAALLGITR